jgi:hypothetical protein
MSQLYKNSRSFISVFITAFQCPLSECRCIQSTPYHPISLTCIIMSFFQLFSSVGIATGYGQDDQGDRVRFSVGSRISILYVVQTELGIQCVPAALSQEVKRLDREAGHSPPTTAEIKKTCITFTDVCTF